MYIVIFCSLLAFFLTYLETKGKINNGMAWGFVIITFLGAIHYDYGNDYMNYYDIYQDITSLKFDFKQVLDGYYYKQIGWTLLCWSFKPIGGFFTMVAVLNIVQNIIVYRFIRKNVKNNWIPLSVGIYLFSTSFYVLSFSMMRQMLVMVIFLGLWDLIKYKKWQIPFLILLLCSTIHSSSFILIPFAFWGYLPIKSVRLLGIFYIVLLGILWLFHDVLNNIFVYAIGLNEDFEYYANYYDDDNNKGLRLGLGFILNLIPFCLSIFYMFSKSDNISEQSKKLVALSALSFLISPFAQVLQLVSRVGMYFSIYSIASIPFIYGNIKNSNIRIILVSLFIIIMMYSYSDFWSSPIFKRSYSEFHTIFHLL